MGLFIARISRGRTVRQFVFGVLLVPTLVSTIWFTVLGGSAIYRQMFGSGGLINADGSVTPENALFDLLSGLPWSPILVGLAILIIVVFFVTSSDSGSLVVDMLASGGDPNPPTWSRVLWAATEGFVAIGLLLAGGLAALQTGAILTAVPFSVIMLAMCAAMTKSFIAERKEMLRLERKARQKILAEEMSPTVAGHIVEHFDEHLGQAVDEHIETALKQNDEG